MTEKQALNRIGYYSAPPYNYHFSFQFWGIGYNQAFVEIKDVEMFEVTQAETPLLAIEEILLWCEKVNPDFNYRVR